MGYPECKPCPFCGSQAGLVEQRLFFLIRWVVECKAPDCPQALMSRPFESPLSAITAWNKRAPIQADWRSGFMTVPLIDNADIVENAQGSIIDALHERLIRVDDLVYVPGVWRCKHCMSVMTKSLLFAGDGKISANTASTVEGCPNDGSKLEQLTWKEHALELNRWFVEENKEKAKQT